MKAKAFLAKTDKFLKIILFLTAAGWVGTAVFVELTDPEILSILRVDRMIYTALMLAAALFGSVHLFLRPKLLLIDQEAKRLYIVKPAVTRAYDCGTVAMNCRGQDRRNFIFHPLAYRYRPKFFYLPLKGKALLEFAAALDEAGGTVICNGCAAGCPLKGKNMRNSKKRP